MRYFTIVLLLTALVSCKKEEVVATNSLIGKWTWDQTFSGWGGTQTSSSNSSQELKFVNTANFIWTKNDTILYEGKYELYYSSWNFMTQQPELILKLKRPTYHEEYIVHQSDNELVINSVGADGPVHSFHR